MGDPIATVWLSELTDSSSVALSEQEASDTVTAVYVAVCVSDVSVNRAELCSPANLSKLSSNMAPIS